jgi:hypothetical protein
MKRGALALIVAVAIVFLAALVGSQSGQAQGGAVAPQIEGSWLATVNSPDIPDPFPALLTFGAGGALLVSDSSFSPANGNVYQGTWIRKGGREIAFSFLGFQFDDEGKLAGYIRVHETIRLDQSGNTYNTVVGTLEFLDVNQTVVVGPLGVTTHGTRINAL